MISNSFPVPQDFIDKLRAQNFKTADEVLLEVEHIAVSFGFQTCKGNGDTIYIYLLCNRHGLPPPQRADKKKNKTSKKIGKRT